MVAVYIIGKHGLDEFPFVLGILISLQAGFYFLVINNFTHSNAGFAGRNRTKAEKERKLTLDIENWLKEKFREGFKSMMTDFWHYDQDNSGKVTLCSQAFLKLTKVILH